MVTDSAHRSKAHDWAIANTPPDTSIFLAAVEIVDCRMTAESIIQAVSDIDKDDIKLIDLEYHRSVIEACADATMAIVLRHLIGDLFIDVPGSGAGSPLIVGIDAIRDAARTHSARCRKVAGVSPGLIGYLDDIVPEDRNRESVSIARELAARFAPVRRRFFTTPIGFAIAPVHGQTDQGEWLLRVASFLDNRVEWDRDTRLVYALLNVAHLVGWAKKARPSLFLYQARLAMINRLDSVDNPDGRRFVNAALLALGHTPDTFVASKRNTDRKNENAAMLRRWSATPTLVERFRSTIREGMLVTGDRLHSDAAKKIDILVSDLEEFLTVDPVLTGEFPLAAAAAAERRARGAKPKPRRKRRK